MSPLGRRVRVRRDGLLPVADELPQAVFSPRSHLVVERDGQPFLFQLNRLYPLSGTIDWELANEENSTHLERLAFHYLEFLESIDVSLAESIVLDWIERNPPWQPGYWLDTWNSYAVSIRSLCMMQWLAANRGALSTSTFEKICASVVEQIRFLNQNLEVDIRGNHLMKNIKALLWAGRFFEGSEADKWHRRAKRLLGTELLSQFLIHGGHDGLHFELSPAYHCQVFADLVECVSVAGDASDALAKALAKALEPMAQVIADLTHPDARISLFGDGGLNMVYLPEECLSVFQQLTGAEAPAVQASFGLEASGYYGMRSARTYLVFDCGPSCADELPAHGHGDILAFEWDVDGHRIVVDAGVREYETGPERDWNRSTRAHNTVTVGDRDQCEFLKSFRMGHRAHGRCVEARLDPQSFSVTGCYTSCHVDGQRVDHTRTIQATGVGVSVQDKLTSKVGEEAVARLLFNHECDVQAEDENTVRVTIGETRVLVESESPMRIVKAKWSPDFGTEFETCQLEIAYGSTPCDGGFSLTVETE